MLRSAVLALSSIRVSVCVAILFLNGCGLMAQEKNDSAAIRKNEVFVGMQSMSSYYQEHRTRFESSNRILNYHSIIAGYTRNFGNNNFGLLFGLNRVQNPFFRTLGFGRSIMTGINYERLLGDGPVQGLVGVTAMHDRVVIRMNERFDLWQENHRAYGYGLSPQLGVHTNGFNRIVIRALAGIPMLWYMSRVHLSEQVFYANDIVETVTTYTDKDRWNFPFRPNFQLSIGVKL